MLGSGGTHRAPGNLKGSRERHDHDRVPHNSHTSVHLANYTEKSLVVLKNYVFMEKNRRQSSHVFGGQGDAFMSEDMTAGVNMELPTEIWEPAKLNKRTEKTIIKKKASGKPRSWMPNGGGMKPYNLSEVQKVVPPEECIIDVKAVKPKVDTWFRLKPKNNVKDSPQEIQQVAKTSKSVGQPHKTNVVNMKRAATTIVRHHVRAERGEENDKDQTVKNLTSFWNDHLQKHPLSVAQKSPTADTRKQKPGDLVKSKSRNQVAGRPKSVGSDGVIQEHTLQPSKILLEKKKLSSVEDILVFAKLSGSRKSGGDCLFTGKQQVHNGKRRPENTVKPKNNILLKKNAALESPRRKKIEASSLPATPHVKATPTVKRPHRRDHPKFVVRLHPRWILALRVLTLSFRPLVDMWRRKCIPQDNTGMLKSSYDDIPATVPTSCLTGGEIIKETLVTSAKKCSERFGKLKRLARQGMSDTLRILTDRRRRMNESSTSAPYSIVRPELSSIVRPLDAIVRPLDAIVRPLDAIVRQGWRPDRLPLVTEPTLAAFSAVAGTRHLKAASLEVLPRGVRIALYVEYQLVFSFILVQTVLLAIVLFIKWLQEYTM